MRAAEVWGRFLWGCRPHTPAKGCCPLDPRQEALPPAPLIFLLVLFLWANIGCCAGKVVPGDFSYCDVYLGDSEEKMLTALGKPLYDKEKSALGIGMVYYNFPHDITVGVFARSRTVAEIIVKDKKYTARDGVRYGATPYKITSTYGKTDKELLDGYICYVYTNPDNAKQRLILATNVTDGVLNFMRLTLLPLNETEAETWAKEHAGETTEDNPYSEVLFADGKEFDLSALSPDAPVELRRTE